MSGTTRPAWHRALPADKQGVWTAKAATGQAISHRFSLAVETGPYRPIRVVLRDGTILDGTYSDERNRWDARKHALAIRMPGRKTQKWIPVSSIRRVWADKGPTLEVLLARFIETTRIV